MIGAQSVAHRVILTYGRFDQLTQDHLQFLRALSMQGDELIVGCATDALAETWQRPCLTSFEARRAQVSSCRFVSHVIALTGENQARTDIVNYNVSAIAMGQEWAGTFDDLQDIAQVLYLPRCRVAQSPYDVAQRPVLSAVG